MVGFGWFMAGIKTLAVSLKDDINNEMDDNNYITNCSYGLYWEIFHKINCYKRIWRQARLSNSFSSNRYTMYTN